MNERTSQLDMKEKVDEVANLRDVRAAVASQQTTCCRLDESLYTSHSSYPGNAGVNPFPTLLEYFHRGRPPWSGYVGVKPERRLAACEVSSYRIDNPRTEPA